MIVFFPQWQGSGEWTAIVDGCRTIAEHVARLGSAGDAKAEFVPILVDPELADEAMDLHDVMGRAALAAQGAIARPVVRKAWDRQEESGEPAILIGGDCSVAPVMLEAAVETHPDLQLLWIDAHADLNSARSSPSQHAHGMALRLSLGQGDGDLASQWPVDRDGVTLVGTRTFDRAEQAYVDRHGIPVIAPGAPETMAAAVRDRLSADAPVHLHIDLDCLDPEVFPHVNYPVPGGLSVDALLAVIAAAKERTAVVGATLTEYAPKEIDGGIDILRRLLTDGLGVEVGRPPVRS